MNNDEHPEAPDVVTALSRSIAETGMDRMKLQLHSGWVMLQCWFDWFDWLVYIKGTSQSHPIPQFIAWICSNCLRHTSFRDDLSSCQLRVVASFKNLSLVQEALQMQTCRPRSVGCSRKVAVRCDLDRRTTWFGPSHKISSLNQPVSSYIIIRKV